MALNWQAVRMHAQEHLNQQLVTACQKKQALEDLDLVGEIEGLLRRTKAILTEAENTKKYG